jgi:hypothetical protein
MMMWTSCQLANAKLMAVIVDEMSIKLPFCRTELKKALEDSGKTT